MLRALYRIPPGIPTDLPGVELPIDVPPWGRKRTTRTKKAKKKEKEKFSACAPVFSTCAPSDQAWWRARGVLCCLG